MKKIICITLTLLVIVISSFAIVANAEQTTDKNCIYFQIPTEKNVEWKNFSRVFCHIWREGSSGGDFYSWQAKGERCTDLGNGYWSYDLSDFEFDKDATYAVIFSNENAFQTYDLTITSDCLGDVVVCNGDTCTNPVDSEKTCAVARWLNNGDNVHPVATVGSDGATLDPDGVMSQDIDRTWGDSTGACVVLPEIDTQEETEQPQDVVSQSDSANADEEVSSNTLQYIVYGVAGVVVVAVVLAVIVVLSKKRKHNQ